MAKSQRAKQSSPASTALPYRRAYRPRSHPYYASVTRASTAPHIPTPADYFTQSLFGEQALVNTTCNPAAIGPGADISIYVKIHIELNSVRCPRLYLTNEQALMEAIQRSRNLTSSSESTYGLIVCVDTPLPTGGIHTTQVDSWTGSDRNRDGPGTPLWLKNVPTGCDSHLRFKKSLGWLYILVDAIDGRPSRCDGDVWSRLLLFIRNAKVRWKFLEFSSLTNIRVFRKHTAFPPPPGPSAAPKCNIVRVRVLAHALVVIRETSMTLRPPSQRY